MKSRRGSTRSTLRRTPPSIPSLPGSSTSRCQGRIGSEAWRSLVGNPSGPCRVRTGIPASRPHRASRCVQPERDQNGHLCCHCLESGRTFRPPLWRVSKETDLDVAVLPVLALSTPELAQVLNEPPLACCKRGRGHAHAVLPLPGTLRLDLDAVLLHNLALTHQEPRAGRSRFGLSRGGRASSSNWSSRATWTALKPVRVILGQSSSPMNRVMSFSSPGGRSPIRAARWTASRARIEPRLA